MEVTGGALIRCFNWQRERDRSIERRLFLRDECLAAGGVELIGRTASGRVSVQSQYQYETQDSVMRPESEIDRVRFFERPEPDPPRSPDFESRSERFPLLPVERLRCPECAGNGHLPCSRCNPSNRSNCTTCRGSGRVRHSTCGGEGRVGRWVERVYKYSHRTRKRDLWCFKGDGSQRRGGGPGVRFRVQHARWIGSHGRPIASYDLAAVRERLGYENAEVRRIAAEGRTAEKELLTQADQESSGTCLFSIVTRHVVPVAYVTMRHGRRADRHIVLGSGDQILEVPAVRRCDGLKLLAWVCVLALLIGVVESIATFFGASPPAAALWIRIWMAAGWPGLVAVGVLVTVASIPGFTRIAAAPSVPRTVALLPASGRSTFILSCLAYLGSHARRFVVLDTDCQAQFDRLTGRDVQEDGAESLTLRNGDGTITRLLEIPSVELLPDGEIARLCANVDEIVVIDAHASAGRAAILHKRLLDMADGSLSVRCLRLGRNHAGKKRQAAGDADMRDVLAGYRSGTISDARCTEIVDRLWAWLGKPQ